MDTSDLFDTTEEAFGSELCTDICDFVVEPVRLAYDPLWWVGPALVFNEEAEMITGGIRLDEVTSCR